MNLISTSIWTLENHCFIVYTVLLISFVVFTLFHKKRVEVQAMRYNAKAEKLAPSGTGNGRERERDYPDDGDPDPVLTPAIPEDTPHIPYKPLHRSDEEVLQRSREYYELMARRRSVRMFSSEPIPQEVLDNIIKTAANSCAHSDFTHPRRHSSRPSKYSREQYELMARRRSVRMFSSEPIPQEPLDNIIKTTGTSPSGAHTEPWTFVVVQDQKVKEAIQEIVEEEEDLNYRQRMSRQWTTDLKPFKTKAQKPYLSDAPALLLVFRQTHSWKADDTKRMHYYSEISVAIAAGILLAAIQYCGLVALTSTPLNCNARLRSLLSRPGNERLELLLPVGRPHQDATVPDLQRKTLDQIMVNI